MSNQSKAEFKGGRNRGWARCGSLFVLTLSLQALAQAPDLTAAGAIAALKTDPSAKPVYGETYNLGSTGLRGWIYIGGGTPYDGTLTIDSRQILVTVASTPGSSVMAVDDVILGAMAGSSGNVTVFTNDARKALGAAIGDAEKTGAGTLRVKRWRAGVINDVNISMAIMGDYAATAPYACPKSALILSNACNKLVSQLLADSNFLTVDYAGAINGLALLAGVASGHPDYATVQTRLETFARSCASTTSLIDGGSTWHLGYVGIFLSEYYLSTSDSQVVSGLNNTIVKLAQMQSRYGTYGHSGSLLKDDGSLHGTVPPYGPVNGCSVPANLAIVLGKKALVAAGQTLDPEIDPAIQRGSSFYGWFANKGGIPYGEHEPNFNNHSSAGKDAMCAIMFSIQTNRTAETEFFTRFALAGFNGLEYAHAGGQNFAFLWNALGANMGGELAVAEYLKQIRWHHNLVRRTDGSFAFEGQEQFGAGSTADGTYLGESHGYDFQTTASYILTYSLPLKRLYITGKNFNPTNTLDASKVTNAIAAATFNVDCPSFTKAQLITALSAFDPMVRNVAAIELAKRSLTAGERTTLRGLLTGTDANGRMGACQALGLLKNVTALPSIVERLNKTIESNSWVRAKAASAIRSYLPSTSSAHRDAMLVAYAANATDPEVIVWDDPVQISNNYLSFALFGDAVYGGNDIAIDTKNAPKNLLYPAVKAGLKQPDSNSRYGVTAFCKNNLSLQDVQALALDIFEVITTKSQADTMWSMEPQLTGLELLMIHKCAEALPIGLSLMDVKEGWAWGAAGFLSSVLDTLVTFGDSARWIRPFLAEDINTLVSVLNPTDFDPTVPKILNTISTIDNAITSPSGLVYLLPLASNQVVAATGATNLTLTGSSCRTNAVAFINVSTPVHGSLTGTPPNLTYTPTVGYSGLDRFFFQVKDQLTNSVPATVSIIVGAAGTGVKGDYYNNMDFTAPVFSRLDPQINFDWGTSYPSNSMAADTFSVKWKGVLTVPESGTYTFSTLNSDGVQLYVDGALVVDDFVDQATSWKDGAPITLSEGQQVELQMNYYENTGSAVAKLKWSGPSFAGSNGVFITKEWLVDGSALSNRPALAYSQSLTLLKNTSKAITLEGAGTPVSYAFATLPSHGTLSGTPPAVTYTPYTDYSGMDSFTFTVNNGVSNSAPATVSLAIWDGVPEDYSWKNAVSGNWSVAANWTNAAGAAVAPQAAGNTRYRLHFTESGTYSVTHNLNNGFVLNQLMVGAEVTFAGVNSLAFSANGAMLPGMTQTSDSAVTFDVPLDLRAMTTLDGTAGGNLTLNGAISGSGGLIKNSTGNLRISNGANTYSGGTLINAGQLTMGDQLDNALGTGPVTLEATLLMERITATNALLVKDGKLVGTGGWGCSWNGSVTLNGDLTVSIVHYDRVFINGNINGVGGVIVEGDLNLPGSGNGVLFTGINTYSGGTYLRSGGRLNCSHSAALGNGNVSIRSGCKLELNYTGNKNIAALTLGGVLQPDGTYGSTASPATYKNDTYFEGTGTVTSGMKNQTITFGPLAAKTYGDVPFSLTATASSLLTVSYSSSNTHVATVASNLVTILNAGTTTITATQVGNDNYGAASPVQQVLTVNKATPVIEWNTPGSIVYGTPLGALQLNATAGGVAGSFVYTPPAGTILPVGAHSLSVQFTPADTGTYTNPAAKQVPISIGATYLEEDFEDDWADNALARTTNGWTSSALWDESNITNPAVGMARLPGNVLFPILYNHMAQRRLLRLKTEDTTLRTPTMEASFASLAVHVDMMVKFNVFAMPPQSISNNLNRKAAFYLLRAGATTNLVVYHGQKTADGFGVPLVTAVTDKLDPDTWYRLTMTFDATTNNSGAEAFCVRINGKPLTSAAAYQDTWKTRIFSPTYSPDGGMWFLSASRREGVSGTNLNCFTAFTFEGTGDIDDLVVTPILPTFNLGTLLQFVFNP